MGERFKSNFFLNHSIFWFVPYRDRDNFPKNDDLFPIGVFPIGTEDCNNLNSNFTCKVPALQGLAHVYPRVRII